MSWFVVLGLLAAAEPLPLTGAKAYATHETVKMEAGKAIDGDETTTWAGDGHDLTVLPSNVFIKLSQPVVIGEIELLSEIAKEQLRLKDVELYAAVGDGWARLGGRQGVDTERTRLTVTPASVTLLRIRIRDTWRDGHAWPRLREVRLFPAERATALKPAPVPDESRAEKLFMDAALGIQKPVKRVVYDPQIGYLGYARAFVETMIAKGTDRYGTVHGPMFASVLDLESQDNPNCELPPIVGQRQGDRALYGGNLQHDLMLLQACYPLSEMTGEPKYGQAADAYLRFFLANCTKTPTGLWPWGEHAHWDFYREAPGHTTHEYLGAAPLSFWQRAQAMDPGAVRREADGLLQHVVNLDTFDFNRHADTAQPLAVPRPAGMVFLDFPRHGGSYIFLWAFEYAQSGDRKYLTWCDQMMAKHQRNADQHSGLIPNVTSSLSNHGVGQQLSLACYMLEAAPLLGDTETARNCAKWGREYLEAVMRLPHLPAEGRLVTSCATAGPTKERPAKLQTPGLDSLYGGGDYLGDAGRLLAQAYRLSGDRRCLDLAAGIARYYAEADLKPDSDTRARVFGCTCGLMLDIYELTGDQRWLEAAERWARQGIELLYCDGLFRGAAGLWYYESELFVSTLVYELVRLEGIRRGVKVEPHSFHR